MNEKMRLIRESRKNIINWDIGGLYMNNEIGRMVTACGLCFVCAEKNEVRLERKKAAAHIMCLLARIHTDTRKRRYSPQCIEERKQCINIFLSQ
jgi:hypothetical protein